MKIKNDGIFRLSENLFEEKRLVVAIVHVEITSHHLLNDLVASLLSLIITIICIVMTVICYTFECLGAKLQLFMEASRYVIWHDVPRGDADSLIRIFVI